MSLGYLARLEPRTRGDDLTEGIAARVYDAAWLLTRQWQLGELTGDDGGTPVSVRHVGTRGWCTGYADSAGSRGLGPGEGPLEAFVEAGPAPATARRRIDTGRALLRAVRRAGLHDRVPALLSAYPLAGAAGAGLAAGRVPDGLAALAALGPGLRADPPALPALPGLTVDADLLDAALSWLEDCAALLGEPAGGAWDETRLDHSATVTAPGLELTAAGHGGGPLDWYAFDATESRPDPAELEPYDVSTLPTRASFRGMPVPRWWQEENAAVDLGSVSADPADLARMALLQFALVYGNDHFVLPVPLPVGSVFRTTHLLVADTFGATFALGRAARSEGSGRWTMFTPTLADGTGVAEVFLLPATALQPLTGRPLEDVHLLRDEMANLAWAVEAIVEGEDGRPARRAERPLPAQPEQPATGGLRYRLGTTVPPHWFPLVPQRSADGDIPDLRLQLMAYSPEPDAVPHGTLLREDLTVAADRIPREGRRVLREAVLARWTDGSPISWTRRRATIGRGEGSSGLRFDDATPG